MTAAAVTYQALQGVKVGPHRLDVPGRQEADALTDWCPRTGCLTPVRPAAVLAEVRGTITGRYGAYRCPDCDAAWLCWWAAPWPAVDTGQEPCR